MKDFITFVKKLNKESNWEKSKFCHFFQSLMFRCFFSKCRYCIYFEPEAGAHKTIRESPILTQGKCKWSYIAGVVITKKEASRFSRCAAFIPVLYNIKGYDIKDDEVKSIIQQRQNYFFSWITILIAIIAAVISWTQAMEGKKERIKSEKALQEVNKTKESIAKIATTLLKINYVIADGGSRLGGTPKEHLDKIKEYQESIKSYLDNDLDLEAKQDIQKINERINERIKSGQK